MWIESLNFHLITLGNPIGLQPFSRARGLYFAIVPPPMKFTLVLAIWACLGFAHMGCLSAQVVTTTLDGVDSNPADGVCDDGTGQCTLRAALQTAASAPGASVIELPEVPGASYEWTMGELYLNAGQITVEGGGARTTIIDAAGSSRFFDLGGGLVSFKLQDLELRGGFDPNDPGGGIETDCDDLTLTNVVIRDCATGIGFGGGIHNRGHFEAYGCLFIDCTATGNSGGNGGGGGGGAIGAGGGVCNWTGSSSVFENCTFTGCVAQGGNGGNGGAGGNGGQGGQSFTNFGKGGDGGDIGGWNSDPDGAAGNIGGGGGGGGYDTGWTGGPGSSGNGLIVGGNGVDGSTGGGGGGGGGGALGGAFFARAGTHAFRHCTFSGNSAFGGSGGSSFTGADAEDGVGQGGAIGTYSGGITMDNCILFGNVAVGAPSGDDEDLFLYDGGPILSDFGNNMVGVMDAGTAFDVASLGNQTGVDPILLPLGDYGGPTDAFMLSACEPISPAIDAGAPLGVAEDQRGVLRDADPDIGAIEGPAPVDLLPIVDEVCPGETLELTLTWPGATTEWPDGSTGDEWTTGAISGGLASITTAEGCVETVALDVTETPIVQPDLGLDYSICPPNAANPGGNTFDAGNAGLGATYAWTVDGNLLGINPTFLMDVEGTLEVTVTLGECEATDDVVVEWYPEYPLDLGLPVTLCLGESVTLDAENPDWTGLPPVFNWQGGPLDSEFEVSTSGTYTVTATTSNNCTNSAQIEVVESPLTTVDLGEDQSICPGSDFILDPGYPGASCLWQDGTVSNTFNVNNTGIYTVNVTLGDCQANGQVFIEVVTPFDPELPATANFCDGDSALILAAFGASNYTWNNGLTGNQLWVDQPGIYEVTSTMDGCDFTAQVSVSAQPLPQFDFGLDVILCEGESIDLAPNVPGADYVIFNDSLTTSVLSVSESGTYVAEVSQGGCLFRDTLEVEVRPIPEFALATDTVLCPGGVLSLETGLSDDVLVTWNTGEVGTSIDVNQPATYVATSQVSGCQFVDSIAVDVSDPIVIPLDALYELCLDDSLLLDVEQGEGVYSSSYAWDDGSMAPRRFIKRGGLYNVEVSNVCDTSTHVFEVQQQVCGCQIYVPTAFTPNNDGNNDAWYPVLDCSPFEYKVTVWDRWGRPVFQATDPSEVWYGQVEGTPGSKTRESGRYYAIDGVYMWEVIIELRKGLVPEIIRQNGYVRVLR